jgi:hypothetical protein
MEGLMSTVPSRVRGSAVVALTGAVLMLAGCGGGNSQASVERAKQAGAAEQAQKDAQASLAAEVQRLKDEAARRATQTPTAQAPVPAAPAAPAVPVVPVVPPVRVGGGTDLALLDQSPHICTADGSPLGCSYRFVLDAAGDLIPAIGDDVVHNRLALVGPAHAVDTSGTLCILVRVRVTALTGSVSVNPGEFVIGSYSTSDAYATTVPVSGVGDLVRYPVSVPAGTDFIGTLAFPDRPAYGRRIA